MPGSEYYDYEDSPGEIAYKNHVNRITMGEWSETLGQLRSVRHHNHRKFEEKLHELMDYARARIWEAELKCV